MIYLDYAATTPVDPRVADLMRDYMTLDGIFGNAASNTHEFGFAATDAIETARAQIAQSINAEPREIIFTSGATESDNLAIKGLAEFYQAQRKHCITMATEHKAVLDSFAALEKKGFTVTYLKPNSEGLVSLDQVAAAMTSDTLLISIMQVNNETGVVQDIDAIAQLAKQQGVYFHTDAAQSFMKLPLDVQKTPIDLISLASHKIYGPKGIGALYVRQKPRVRLAEQISGGKHERGLRSGTLATHQIMGFVKAVELMQHEHGEQARLQQLQTLLLQQLTDVPEHFINGSLEHKIPNILNLRFNGIDSEALMASCQHLAFSAGSACTSATLAPSHVLQAMGLSNVEANNSIRLSFGRFSTEHDILETAKALKQQVARLRDLSPLWDAS
jgi:cysteine desulfurase